MKLDHTALTGLKTRVTALTQPWLRPIGQRIDALQWRERLILFLLLTTVVGVILDTLVISPLRTERRTQLRAQALQSEALKALRLQLTQALLLSPTDSPRGQILHGLRQQHAEQAELAQQIASLAAAATQAATAQQDLPSLLAELLRQQAGLTLVTLSTISDVPKFAGTDGSTGALDGWQWQGVELRVAGDYLALLRYLRQLESDLPGLRWGEMKLSAATAEPAALSPARRTGLATAQASLLQLQVFLLKAK
jgi:hypothetical protein